MNYLLLFIIILCIIILNNGYFLDKSTTEKYQNKDKDIKTPNSDMCHQSLNINYGAYNQCENWWHCFKKNGNTSTKWCDGNPSQCTKYKDIIKNADIDFNKNYSEKDGANINLDGSMSENQELNNLLDVPKSVEDNISWEDFREMIINTDKKLTEIKKKKVDDKKKIIENNLPNVDYLAEEERWRKFNNHFNKSKHYESKYLELPCTNDLLICPNSAEILNEL